MAEKRIIYNGVPMHPDWPAKILKAQKITSPSQNPSLRLPAQPQEALPKGFSSLLMHHIGSVRSEFTRGQTRIPSFGFIGKKVLFTLEFLIHCIILSDSFWDVRAFFLLIYLALVGKSGEIINGILEAAAIRGWFKS